VTARVLLQMSMVVNLEGLGAKAKWLVVNRCLKNNSDGVTVAALRRSPHPREHEHGTEDVITRHQPTACEDKTERETCRGWISNGGVVACSYDLLVFNESSYQPKPPQRSPCTRDSNTEGSGWTSSWGWIAACEAAQASVGRSHCWLQTGPEERSPVQM
jgi:hypothetical protein